MPAFTPRCANQPRVISKAKSAGAEAQCGCSLCGCMSAILMIVPFASTNATDRGINVFFMRYSNVIISGALAGLGGAYFTLQQIGNFLPNMTGGRGFIALAAMIFGRWTPVGAFLASLLFAGADALSGRLQIYGVHVPYQILGMLPYILTIIVVAGAVGRAVAPAADGKPYTKG